MSTATETIEGLVKQEYKYGFYTDLETESAPPGISMASGVSTRAFKALPLAAWAPVWWRSRPATVRSG